MPLGLGPTVKFNPPTQPEATITLEITTLLTQDLIDFETGGITGKSKNRVVFDRAVIGWEKLKGSDGKDLVFTGRVSDQVMKNFDTKVYMDVVGKIMEEMAPLVLKLGAELRVESQDSSNQTTPVNGEQDASETSGS